MNRLLWVVALTAGGAPAVLAQSLPATPAMATKAPANIGVEPYRSAFEGFRPWNDDAAQDWRRVNDEMKQLGGHTGHLRAAPIADKPAGATGNPMTREVPAPGGAMPGKAPEKER